VRCERCGCSWGSQAAHRAADDDGDVYTTVEVRKREVVGTFAVLNGPGPHPSVVALSGSGGGVPSWWGDLLAPHGIAVLVAAYFGVDPLPPVLCEIPVETVRPPATGCARGRRSGADESDWSADQRVLSSRC
jgi:hypothetical protein